MQPGSAESTNRKPQADLSQVRHCIDNPGINRSHSESVVKSGVVPLADECCYAKLVSSAGFWPSLLVLWRSGSG
jgi:hypothetical protein